MPSAIPSYIWSGAYVGVFGGAAFNRTRATDITGEEYGGNTPGASMSLSGKGFVGGVTLGYNFQSGNWVFGPEFELGWASNSKTRVIDSDDGLYTKYGFLATATGRIGYTFDRTLIFGKGGLAAARITSGGGEWDGRGHEDNDGKYGFDGDESGFGKATRFGWTLGAGIEHAFAQGWSVKAEYDFAQFRNKTYNGVDHDTPFRFKDQLHSVKLGLNYKF